MRTKIIFLIALFSALFCLLSSGVQGQDTLSIKKGLSLDYKDTDTSFVRVIVTELSYSKPKGITLSDNEEDSLLYSPSHKILKKVDEPVKAGSFIFPVDFVFSYRDIEYSYDSTKGTVEKGTTSELHKDWKRMEYINSLFFYGYIALCICGFLLGFFALGKRKGVMETIAGVTVRACGVITIILLLVMLGTVHPLEGFLDFLIGIFVSGLMIGIMTRLIVYFIARRKKTK